MKKLARLLGEDSQQSELVELLHDLGLNEVRSDMSKHGIGSSEKLKGLLLTCFFMYCL